VPTNADEAATPGLASLPDIRRTFGPDLLKGEVAVVTGGGSGLGYAIARDFLTLGADVVITSRSTERLASAEDRITAETQRLCGSMPCEVRDEEQVDRLREYVLARFGPATILVNSAAANFFMRAERMTRRALDTVVSTNLFGTFNVTRSFVPAMLEARRGAVLNLTMCAPERGFPGYSHAGAAKAAVISLTATWAYEWGPYGIRVNGIAPGPVPTAGAAANMLATEHGSAFQNFIDRVPVRRLGTPEDVSAAAVFLCSPAGSWITGQNLMIDGGLCLNTPSSPRF
jgi:NAD(P)-dependent dehydrogenase (short-subunit alcohol dehydrogenase family)